MSSCDTSGGRSCLSNTETLSLRKRPPRFSVTSSLLSSECRSDWAGEAAGFADGPPASSLAVACRVRLRDPPGAILQDQSNNRVAIRVVVGDLVEPVRVLHVRG